MPKTTLPTNEQIVTFLSSTTANATFLQSLKIRYRPFVCPFDELLGYIDKDQKVFDIGCGSGQFCALAAEFTNSKDIYGIEIDSHLVANAKSINKRFQKTKKVNFAVFDGNSIPTKIKDYDLIYMIDVYHHIPVSIRDEFLAEVYRKMKPGAKLVFKDIDGSSPFVICNKIHDLIFAQEFSHEIGFNHAKELAKKIGFTINEQRKKRIFVYPHYFLVLQK